MDEEEDPYAAFFMDDEEADNILKNLDGFDEEDPVMCCCKPDVPHSEEMKFKLHFKKKSDVDRILFKKKKAGEVIEL